MIRVHENGSVRVHGIKPEILLSILIAERIWSTHGADLVITSLIDGKHSLGSLHYVGMAVDLRRWQLDDPEQAVEELKAALGPDYDVILESTHVHVEFQPKRSY